MEEVKTNYYSANEDLIENYVGWKELVIKDSVFRVYQTPDRSENKPG